MAELTERDKLMFLNGMQCHNQGFSTDAMAGALLGVEGKLTGEQRKAIALKLVDIGLEVATEAGVLDESSAEMARTLTKARIEEMEAPDDYEVPGEDETGN